MLINIYIDMKNRNIVIDTNIFYAVLNDKDSLHIQASKLLEKMSEHILIVPYSVISETSTLLTYRQWKKKADDFVSSLRNTKNIFIVSNSMDDEMNLFLEVETKISFTDISLIAVSKKYNAELATFDKQLLQLYKKLSK